VIEHIDIALRDWLTEALDVNAVEFGRGAGAAADTGAPSRGRRSSAATTASLRLVGVTERDDRRSNAVTDLRADDGRVIGRRGAARVFDLDYVCEVDGDAIDAHRVLGQLLGLLIDNDTLPADFVPDAVVPEELTKHDVTIEIELAPPEVAERASVATTDACVAVRATVPIWPSVDTQIGEPAEHLHLDVGPEPRATEPRAAVDADGGSDDDGAAGSGPIPPLERKWKTVRRREFIAPGSTAASAAKD